MILQERPDRLSVWKLQRWSKAMLRRPILIVLLVTLAVGPAFPAHAQAPTVFKKLDFYVQEGDEMEDHDAQLILDPNRRLIVFAEEDDGRPIFATVSWDRITGVTYENSKHARITAGLLVAWPLLFLSGKKHWLTVTFGPGTDGSPGGYVFARMDKDNFQTILAAINGFTGYEIRRIEENGEISVLYPGAAPAAPSSPTNTQGQPAGPTGASVSAGALPPRSSNTVAAAPLPPPATTATPPTLANKGVEWTTRTANGVGYVWAAEVANANPVEVEAVVSLRLFDGAGALLHETYRVVTIPPSQRSSFSAEGEVPEAQATRADHWTFDVEPVAPPTMATPGPGAPVGVSPSAQAGGRTGEPAAPPGAAAPAAEIVPVPLTDSMVRPALIPDSVTFAFDDPRLQELDLSGRQITIRCLIREDGTVADAKVFRIAPSVPTSIETTLEDAIRAKAIRSWRFSPARRAGVAVPVWDLVTVEYTGGS